MCLTAQHLFHGGRFLQGAQMTLAQHLGLVPRPPPLLTETEWDEVHLKSRIRQDSERECPICREDFGTGPQVWQGQPPAP